MVEASFLMQAGWGQAERHPLAGDASSRRYERLALGAKTAILMIAPDAKQEVRRFVEVSNWLIENGFSAPRIFAQDDTHLLLEDLGDDLFARILTQAPSREAPLYAEITRFLQALHRHPAAPFLTQLDGVGLGALTGLAFEWYQPQVDGHADASHVAMVISKLYQELNNEKPVTCLRDFHAENLLWLPDRVGAARLGLLDFQDAVAAHPAYDLVSALQDARRDVSPAVERAEVSHYAQIHGIDIKRFSAIYALLGVQRSLRIMGVFTRLCLHGGKAHYVDLMPRTWAYVERNLAHPALGELRAALAPLPAPTLETLQRIKSQCPTLTR